MKISDPAAIVNSPGESRRNSFSFSDTRYHLAGTRLKHDNTMQTENTLMTSYLSLLSMSICRMRICLHLNVFLSPPRIANIRYKYKRAVVTNAQFSKNHRARVTGSCHELVRACSISLDYRMSFYFTHERGKFLKFAALNVRVISIT